MYTKLPWPKGTIKSTLHSTSPQIYPLSPFHELTHQQQIESILLNKKKKNNEDIIPLSHKVTWYTNLQTSFNT